MITCPNCGSTAQVVCFRESYDRPDTHAIYICGCGKLFVAEKEETKNDK
jgi:DNA-directed RNA polymerase subunit RPC12/RpoP